MKWTVTNKNGSIHVCDSTPLTLQIYEAVFLGQTVSQFYLQTERREPHAIQRAPRVLRWGRPRADQELDGLAQHVTKHHLEEGPENIRALHQREESVRLAHLHFTEQNNLHSLDQQAWELSLKSGWISRCIFSITPELKN